MSESINNTIQHSAPLGTALPREYYVSESIYQQELDKVFRRQWLLVGHVSGVKQVGQYYVKQVGPESLIIARDGQHRVRAFFNVCRHRGYPILDDWATGTANGFVCPYHRWTYDTGGKLVTVPGAKDGETFNFRDWDLQEARCETFQGFIYVWLSDTYEPTPLRDSLQFVNDEALARVQPERMKMAHREVYPIAANWKSLLENDCECYHCARGGHPALAVACDYTGFYAETQKPQHFPLRDGMKTFSIDGELVCQVPLGDGLPDGFSTGFLSFPHFAGPVFFKDHAVSLELTQTSPGTSLVIAEWYVHEDAVAGRDYEVDRLKHVFHVTNCEDKAFAERNYRGQQSSRYVPGPLVPGREDGTAAALGLYREMLDRP